MTKLEAKKKEAREYIAENIKNITDIYVYDDSKTGKRSSNFKELEKAINTCKSVKELEKLLKYDYINIKDGCLVVEK